jgi:hypothetical protein
LFCPTLLVDERGIVQICRDDSVDRKSRSMCCFGRFLFACLSTAVVRHDEPSFNLDRTNSATVSAILTGVQQYKVDDQSQNESAPKSLVHHQQSKA